MHDVYGDTVGFEEARRWDELQRRWLLWRKEWIRAGTDAPFELVEVPVERQQA